MINSFIEAWVSFTGLKYIDEKSDNCQFIIPESDPVEFLYLFAGRLIFLLEAENFQTEKMISWESDNKSMASITVAGHRFSKIMGYRNIPKAPTYHEIEFSGSNGYGQIIFDL